MLRQQLDRLEVATPGRGFTRITRDVAGIVHGSGIKNGLATLQLQHTSASLLIQENADPTVRGDLDRYFARLVRDGDPMFEHNQEGDDDMAAHIRTALTTVNLSIPITDGTLALGTWQGIYLWEHRAHPHHRRIVIHLLGE